VGDRHLTGLVGVDTPMLAPKERKAKVKTRVSAIDQKQPNASLDCDSRIFNKIFVVSGSLRSLSHAEVRAALENRGALFSRRISKKTDYLIIGRKPGSVAVTARIYNIKTLNETDLLNLLGINRQYSMDLYWSDVE
jgi:NAD-dependent DNA ligase